MIVLRQLLYPLKPQEFFDNKFTKAPFSIPNGAKSFINLLSWKVIEDILHTKKSILRIVQDGKMVSDYSQLGYKDALHHYKDGKTLLIRYAERADPKLNEVAEDFSKTFHTKVDIQLYCTPEGHNAFGWHFDVEEVFIIQAKGSKEYSIRPNTVHPNPLLGSITKDQGFEKEKSSFEIKILLSEGDWLYIPSGWWHIARTQSESMHLSIGLMPSSAINPVEFLPRYLAQFPGWRARMPLHATFESEESELDFYQDAFKKLARDLEDKFSQREFIRDFLKHARDCETYSQSNAQDN